MLYSMFKLSTYIFNKCFWEQTDSYFILIDVGFYSIIVEYITSFVYVKVFLI